MIQEYFVIELLKDYLLLMCSVASGGYVGNPNSRYERVVTLAKTRCEEIGILWNDTYLPEYVQESLCVGIFKNDN